MVFSYKRVSHIDHVLLLLMTLFSSCSLLSSKSLIVPFLFSRQVCGFLFLGDNKKTPVGEIGRVLLLIFNFMILDPFPLRVLWESSSKHWLHSRGVERWGQCYRLHSIGTRVSRLGLWSQFRPFKSYPHIWTNLPVSTGTQRAPDQRFSLERH